VNGDPCRACGHRHAVDGTCVHPEAGLIRCTCEADYMCHLHGTGYDFRHQHQRYTETTAAYLAGERVTPGDCWRTALACLLEVARDDVPHFIDLYDGGVGAEGEEIEQHPEGPRWWRESVRWVQQQRPGWTIAAWDWTAGEPWSAFYGEGADGAPDRVILTAPSPRGAWNHTVLVDAQTGELEHDPYPGGQGVLPGPGDRVALVREEWL
jgi:hypothetical protein